MTNTGWLGETLLAELTPRPLLRPTPQIYVGTVCLLQSHPLLKLRCGHMMNHGQKDTRDVWRHIQKRISQIKRDSLKETFLPLQYNLVVSICDSWNRHTRIVATRKQTFAQSQYAKVGGKKNGRSLGPQCQLLDQSSNCLAHFSSYMK